MSRIAVKNDSRAAHRLGRLRHEPPKRLGCRPRPKFTGNDLRNGGFLGKIQQTILQHSGPCKWGETSDDDDQYQPGEFHSRKPNPHALPRPAHGSPHGPSNSELTTPATQVFHKAPISPVISVLMPTAIAAIAVAVAVASPERTRPPRPTDIRVPVVKTGNLSVNNGRRSV